MMTTAETVRTLIAASPAYRARALKALAETCEMLEKEMRYSPDLRNQERIAFLTGHIAHLEGML